MSNTLAVLAGQVLEKLLKHLTLEESPLLSRVNSARGNVLRTEQVGEIANEPNYEAALAVL